MNAIGTHVSASKGVTLTLDDVADRPWRQLGEWPGVQGKILWGNTSMGSYAGLLHLDPRAGIPGHKHRNAAHHLWIIDGSCRVGGVKLERGSYSYVPPQESHAIESAGPNGCTLFYTYLIEDIDEEMYDETFE